MFNITSFFQLCTFSYIPAPDQTGSCLDFPVVAEAVRQVEEEVRSVNSSHSVAASTISAPQLSLIRQLLRIYITPFDETDPSVVLHGAAGDNDFEW